MMSYVVFMEGYIGGDGNFVWERPVIIHDSFLVNVFSFKNFIKFKIGGDFYMIDKERDIVYKKVIDDVASISEFKDILKILEFECGIYYYWEPFSYSNVGAKVICVGDEDG